MKIVEELNIIDFATVGEAKEALLGAGFGLVEDTTDIWRTGDGLVDATIKERFRDRRFYIVLFA